MAILCRDCLPEGRGLLFIMTPRTGCSALGRHLREHLGGEPLPARNLRDAAGKVKLGWKHNTVHQLLRHGVLDEAERRRLTVFTTVRNPFDQVASAWVKNRKKLGGHLDRESSWIHQQPKKVEEVRFAMERDFDAWVRYRFGRRRGGADGARPGRKPDYDPFRFQRGVDLVLRHERLEDDLAALLRGLGLDERLAAIPRHNPTRGKGDYRQYFSPRSRRIVEAAFGPMIAAYGYSFDGLPPDAPPGPVPSPVPEPG